MNQTIEERLRGLYILQNIDSQLDELEAMKGNLPNEVARLEEQLTDRKNRLEELRGGVTKAKIDRDKADVEIIAFGERIATLKDQQYKVQSNKEYDALTREIAHAETAIGKLEKQMQETEGRLKVSLDDIESIEKEIGELQEKLAEKGKELAEVSAMNEDEELKLKHEREKVIVRIDKGDIVQYDRIRKAKGGTAVASSRRGSCGGCHNRIPPQRMLELRQHMKIYKCEHCGRILISEEIVSSTPVAV
jgi:predicted  nucleic acid-binding Zn-ribbon protein